MTERSTRHTNVAGARVAQAAFTDTERLEGQADSPARRRSRPAFAERTHGRAALETPRSQGITPLASRVSGLVVAGYCRTVCTVVFMESSGSPYRARRREREQQRRQQAQRTPSREAGSPKAGSGLEGQDRRTAATLCGWCGGPITPGTRGPIPKWCSATCRHRAWEQARAAASGLSAVKLVERRVEVQVPLSPVATGPDCSATSLANRTTGGSTTATCPPSRGPWSPYWRLTGDARTSPALPTCTEPEPPEVLQ